jgi:hypothetical protein
MTHIYIRSRWRGTWAWRVDAMKVNAAGADAGKRPGLRNCICLPVREG